MSLINQHEQGAEIQKENTEIAREDSTQTSHFHINQLPQEVLSLIFLACDDPRMERNLNLALVCKIWQCIVISEPILWSNIIIPRNRDITRIRYFWRQIETSLFRSKQVSLDILIDLRDIPSYHEYLDKGPKDPVSQEQYDDLTATTIRRLLGNNREHVYRWRSFFLHCSPSLSTIAITNVWKVLEGQYDALAKFQIYIRDIHSPIHLPRVSYPALGCCTTKQPADPGKMLVNPSKMTLLSFYSSQMASEFLRMAGATTFSALSTLIIWISSREEVPDAPLHFPRLSTLRFLDTISGIAIPPLLDAPYLKNISFVWQRGGGAHFLPPSIFAKLETLQFHLKYPSNSEEIYQCIREPLRVALSSSTSLKKLQTPAAPSMRENLIELVSELRGEGHSLAKLKEITMMNMTFVDGKKKRKLGGYRDRKSVV